MISILRRAIAVGLVVLALGLTSCGGDRDVPVVLLPDNEPKSAANPLIGAIAEVSPPERIQQLKPYLDVYEPQVRIARPDPDETVMSTTVQVELQTRDFPIYKDESLGFGPHLHLFVDDQPHQAIYDADAPIILDDLAPGTHTLRLLAVRPWGESFKNEGAYDQITFSVFAASPENNPDDSQPVLTYNQPQDQYGAEPILLDFHLHNAPPHLVAQADETMMDWRIRCTINGEAFIFDRWQPIYLQGFQPGKNWVRLELIDETGNLIDNAFNSSIRVIDYQPGGEDGLSQLVRGDLSLNQAKALIDPDYEAPTPTVPAPPEPEAATGPTPEAPEAPDSETLQAPAEPQAETGPTPEAPDGETLQAPAEPKAETVPTPEAPDAERSAEPAPEPAPDTSSTPDAAPPKVSPEPEPLTKPAPSTEPTPEVETETEPAPESVEQPSESTTESPAAPESPSAEEMDERSPDEAIEKPTPLVDPDTPEPVPGDRGTTPADESVEAPAGAKTSAPATKPQPETPDASGGTTANPPDETEIPETPAIAPSATDASEPTAAETDDATDTADTADVPASSAAPAMPTDKELPAATAPSNLDGVPADDLTEDSPLMESQQSDFPEESPSVAPPLPPEAADLTSEEPDTSALDKDIDQPDADSPDTDLKTLEDNADVI